MLIHQLKNYILLLLGKKEEFKNQKKFKLL
jgi:hypothetical protein